MPQIRVGLIGYGMSGAKFHAPLITSLPEFILHTVVSSDREKVQKDFPSVKVLPDMEALLAENDIDLVVITSPNITHFTYAKQALLANKHVIVEKPFVNSVKDADELIALAASRNLLLSVFHNRRWDSDFFTVKKCIQEGLLGEIYTYEVHYDRFRPVLTGKWKEGPFEGSGVLYDLGSHLVDQALQLFGMPQTIWADILAQRFGAQADDYFHVVMGYGRLRVILHGGCVVKQPGPHFAVHGNLGSLLTYGFDSQEKALQNGFRPGHSSWGEEQEGKYCEVTLEKNLGVTTKLKTVPGSYQAYYQGFYDAAVNGAPLPVTALEARNVITVIKYALQSQQEQKVITLPGYVSHSNTQGGLRVDSLK